MSRFNQVIKTGVTVSSPEAAYSANISSLATGTNERHNKEALLPHSHPNSSRFPSSEVLVHALRRVEKACCVLCRSWVKVNANTP
jgi:proteasome lid subunit RPN8/RPN11